MRRTGSTLLLAGALVCAATTAGAQTYFGLDLAGGGNTNSLNARNQFFTFLTGGVGTETFEGIAPGTSNPALTFPGAGTANLAGTGQVVNGTNSGRIAVSGSNYYEARSATGGSSTFTVNFSDPVAAFGFFGTDIGDFGSQLTLRFFLTGGGTADWVLPYVAGGANEANLLYAGYINTATFTSVAFIGTDASDVFGFDDMTIGSISQVVPDPSVVPEPSTVLLLGSGLLGMLGVAHRRRRCEG